MLIIDHTNLMIGDLIIVGIIAIVIIVIKDIIDTHR